MMLGIRSGVRYHRVERGIVSEWSQNLVLSWSAHDRFVVRMEFDSLDKTVIWECDHELLGGGGAGDIRFFPLPGEYGRWMCIVLDSPDGRATLAVSAADLAAFHGRVKVALEAAGPIDAELDAELDAILGGAA